MTATEIITADAITITRASMSVLADCRDNAGPKWAGHGAPSEEIEVAARHWAAAAKFLIFEESYQKARICRQVAIDLLDTLTATAVAEALVNRWIYN